VELATGDVRAINATIARALTDSEFLDSLGRELASRPAGTGSRPDDHDSYLDYDRLAQLAAFVCKIQHNDLWTVLPHSLRMINRYGLELDVFKKYNSIRMSRGTPLRQRAESFSAFLSGYMRDHRIEIPGGEDLVAHEWLVCTLSKGWHQYDVQQLHPGVPGDPQRGVWRPQLRGLVLIRAYDYDPIAITQWIGSPEVRADQGQGAASGDFFVCYFKDPSVDGPPRLFRIDPLLAVILENVNGERTPGDIAESIEYRCDDKTVANVLRSFAAHGLISGPDPQSRAYDRQLSLTDPLLQALNGHAVSRILYTLEEAGILKHLLSPQQVDSLAIRTGVDGIWLECVLDFVSHASPIVRSLGHDRYVVDSEYAKDGRLAFELRKFIGAYGPCLDVVDSSPMKVNQSALARAFDQSARTRRSLSSHPSLAATTLREFHVASYVLDLGCGPAELLVELAISEPSFKGIGVDVNFAMCAAARARITEVGVTAQIQIRHGDALDVLSRLPSSYTRHITAVHASSYFNALFHNGGSDAIGALVGLREVLPGRILVIGDYYGRLGSGKPVSHLGWTLLQDLAQACSGQGVPPSERAGWEALYRRAGCRLISARDESTGGYIHFIHVVKLGET
jgi:SAM-dependent methyltransferase